MNSRFSRFIFRTRGLYMFIAFMISMVMKSYSYGTTPLGFFIMGIMIMAVVQAFRMYSASYLWGRQAVTEVEADFLCTSGPYAHLRNPLYLGNFMIGVGLSIVINEWYAYVLFIMSYAFVYSIVIPYEERFLEEKFGNVYLKYRANIGRLIPRLKGYRGAWEVVPNYKAGVSGEIHVPIFLAVIFTVVYLLFVR